MANGFAPYILSDIRNTVGNATANTKVDFHGFVKYLYTGAGAKPIQTTVESGHTKTVKVRYRQRNTKAQTDTTASCGVVLTPARLEADVNVGNTRSIAWHLPHSLLKMYMDEASSRQNLPSSTPLTGVSAELIEILYSGANGIMAGINDDLIGLLSFGKNSVSGVSTATSLNISKDKSVIDLTQGMVKLLSDYHRNGLTGRPQVVGSGLMYNYVLSQALISAADTFGFDSRRAIAELDFWADRDFATIKGANNIGVFEPGAVQMVEAIEHLGFQGGKLANSTFGTMPFPVVDPFGNATPLIFDWQLRELDCDTELTDMYSGQTATYSKGYSLMIKKDFGLFQLPADAYRHEDVQRSVNGALLYDVTNICEEC